LGGIVTQKPSNIYVTRFDGFISRLNPTLKLSATIFLGLVFAN